MGEDEFISMLKDVNVVFSAIHGIFGENGEIQELLEQNHIPFVGSDSDSCRVAFDKELAAKMMAEHGFYVPPSLTVTSGYDARDIDGFFASHTLRKAIVKPTLSGSSIGVYCVTSGCDAAQKVDILLGQGYKSVIIEPFCVGKEFTIIVMQSANTKKPVALMPSEININLESDQIFDYRKKYLPTEQTRYYTPPRFSDDKIEEIRQTAAKLFSLFGLKDIARLDGWLLDDGNLWFSDINTAAGMEQNSFVFQQSTRVGLEHSELLKHVINTATNRQYETTLYGTKKSPKRQSVKVLFGGSNAERQISLMSGTNVWLKLKKSNKYDASPYLLDKNDNVWYLPYMFTLSHTVEEIYENCVLHSHSHAICDFDPSSKVAEFSKKITHDLEVNKFCQELPIKYSFQEFLEMAKKENSFVFLALHGGDGENGVIQAELETYGLRYNGSDSKVSKLCMDKYETGRIVNKMNDNTIISLPKLKFTVSDVNDSMEFWNQAVKQLQSPKLIIKPACDGSSAGIVKLLDSNDFNNYLSLLRDRVSFFPQDTFESQPSIIEAPSNIEQEFFLEAFIETDKLNITEGNIVHHKKDGWIEYTVGVVETRGKYHSLNPSITIAENEILSIEEKFQGGTGTNLTPPPTNLITSDQINTIKQAIEKVSKFIGIKNYSRTDIFFNINTNQTIIIEINTLPALTPSTVLYHQALCEEPALYPRDFLEMIIDGAMK